jgi:hypothetical protein
VDTDDGLCKTMDTDDGLCKTSVDQYKSEHPLHSDLNITLLAFKIISLFYQEANNVDLEQTAVMCMPIRT